MSDIAGWGEHELARRIGFALAQIEEAARYLQCPRPEERITEARRYWAEKAVKRARTMLREGKAT